MINPALDSSDYAYVFIDLDINAHTIASPNASIRARADGVQVETITGRFGAANGMKEEDGGAILLFPGARIKNWLV